MGGWCLKKQIEKVWWSCAVGTVLFSIVDQTRLDPSHWTMGLFLISFFGLLLSSLAWLLASHVEYVRNLERKVKELEKQTSGINLEKSESPEAFEAFSKQCMLNKEMKPLLTVTQDGKELVLKLNGSTRWTDSRLIHLVNRFLFDGKYITTDSKGVETVHVACLIACAIHEGKDTGYFRVPLCEACTQTCAAASGINSEKSED
jgi:hypothetical protein